MVFIRRLHGNYTPPTLDYCVVKILQFVLEKWSYIEGGGAKSGSIYGFLLVSKGKVLNIMKVIQSERKEGPNMKRIYIIFLGSIFWASAFWLQLLGSDSDTKREKRRLQHEKNLYNIFGLQLSSFCFLASALGFESRYCVDSHDRAPLLANL